MSVRDKYSTVHPEYHYKFHPIAKLNQDPPVQNTWYTVFDGTGGIRIRQVTARQINDEAAAKDIEFRMTIDGVSVDATVTAQLEGSWYFWTIGPGVERVIGGTTIRMIHEYEVVECLDALIEMRMTSAPGTNQKLDGRVHYETFERIGG